MQGGGGAEFDRPRGKNDPKDPWEVNVLTNGEIQTTNICNSIFTCESYNCLPFVIEQPGMMTIFLYQNSLDGFQLFNFSSGFGISAYTWY